MKFKGNFLREKRKEKGLTQDQLARKIGLDSGSWISAWETGVASIRGDNLTKLVEFFCIPAEDWWEYPTKGGKNVDDNKL